MKLDVKAFAIACGLIWGLGLLVLTWWIILFHGSSQDVTFIGRVYLGYEMTPTGSLFGLLWGLFDGAIGGAIFAWVYNKLVGEPKPAPAL